MVSELDLSNGMQARARDWTLRHTDSTWEQRKLLKTSLADLSSLCGIRARSREHMAPMQ